MYNKKEENIHYLLFWDNNFSYNFRYFSMRKYLSILFVDDVVFVEFIFKSFPPFLEVLELKVLFHVEWSAHG